MNFQQAVTTCLQKYATFSGRASRAEFWWFLLFQMLVMLAAGFVSELAYNLAALALLLPGLAAGARRLHDYGKSAWFLLLWFVPLIGWVILIYWNAKPSGPANEHGAPAEDVAPLAPQPPGAV